jgi:hypothetical protein
LVYCLKCGKELSLDAQYCDRCGHKVGDQLNTLNIRVGRIYSNTNWLDSVGFGIFLIAVAVVFLRYFWFFDELFRWLKTWELSGPTMLPTILIPPIFYFFILVGTWGILKGLIRISLGDRISKGLRDVVDGGFGLSVAMILRIYSIGRLSASNIFPTFLILFALMLIFSGIVSIIDK